MIYVEAVTNRTKMNSGIEELCHYVVEKALSYMKFDDPYVVNILAKTPEKMQEINYQYREIDRVTDVLSFPMIDWPEGYDLDFVAQNRNQLIDWDTQEILLGDILVCLKQVSQQAEEFGNSQAYELAYLLTHSVLHLLGYDHMEETEEKEMNRLTKQIVADMDLTDKAIVID